MHTSFKGIGVFDLSKYLQITELRNSKRKVKPLHVVATHTHFDHSGTQNQKIKMCLLICIMDIIYDIQQFDIITF